jgi:hypothetical protein
MPMTTISDYQSDVLPSACDVRVLLDGKSRASRPSISISAPGYASTNPDRRFRGGCLDFFDARETTKTLTEVTKTPDSAGISLQQRRCL